MRFISRLLIACACVQVVAGAAHAREETPGSAAVADAPSQKSDEPKGQHFNIWEYQVSGNTLLENSSIEKTVYPFLGPDKSIEDVENARVELETLYKDAGYPTVIIDIPEQDVSNGVVALEVVEGRIDRLRVSGSRYFSLGRIRKSVPALAEGEVPYLPDVQEQLQALNTESADRSVTPVFRAGRTPGTVEVDLRVKDELPLHGGIEVNGRNSADTTRSRLVADIRYDNLWQRAHSVALTYQTSPEDTDEVEVIAGTYVMPVGGAGDRLAFYAISSESDSDVASAGALAVIGEGTIIGTRWIKPLAPLPGYFHNFTFGADYKDFDEGTELVGADTLETPINYTKFSTQYSGTLLNESAQTSFSAGIDFAPRGLGNKEKEFEEKRFEATPNFAFLTGSFSHEYRFDNGIRLKGATQGQLAGEPLISNEQFSVGGAESVRGYHESEILGDDGLQASLEVHTPAWVLPWELGNLHALAFADGAYIKLHDTLPGTDDSDEIYGAGFGLRLDGGRVFKAALDLAWPFRDTESVDAGDTRLHFLVRTGF